MSSIEASREVPSETDGPQVTVPQAQKPKVMRTRLFNFAMKDMRQKNPRDIQKEFITKRREAANSLHKISDGNPEASSATNNSNGHSLQNSTVSNSSLENSNLKTNVKNNSIENVEIKHKCPTPQMSHSTSFPTPQKDKLKDSYDEECSVKRINNIQRPRVKDCYDIQHNANRINNAETFKKDLNKANMRPEIYGRGGRRLSDSNDVIASPSSHLHITAISSVQPSLVNNVGKISSAKEHITDTSLNKSTEKQGSEIGWPELKIEDSKKKSVNIDDGWGPISDTDDSSWNTVDDTGTLVTSNKNVRYSERECERPPLHKTLMSSTQSGTVSDRPKPNFKSKENYQCSVSTTSAQLSSVEGRTKQYFNNKDNFHHDISPVVAASCEKRTNFHGRDHNQRSTLMSIQSASKEKSKLQKFNDRDGNVLPKLKYEKDKMQDSSNYRMDTDPGNDEDEFGWPKLDTAKDRRHSLDDGGGWSDHDEENKSSGNRAGVPYRRSTSTPFAQSSMLGNNNLEASNKRKYHDEGKTKQYFNNKDNFHHDISPVVAASCDKKTNFDDRHHYQCSKLQNTLMPIQTAFKEKSKLQNFNNRDRNVFPKLELEKNKMQDSPEYDVDKNRSNDVDESGWPKLDTAKDRRHSLDDDGGWSDHDEENKYSGNRAGVPYRRSTSTPFAQSSTLGSNNLEASNTRKYHNDDSRGNKTVEDRVSANSNASATDWKTVWREKEMNQGSDSNSQPYTPAFMDETIKGNTNNVSDEILYKAESPRNSNNIDELDDSADEWSTISETSNASTIVLENDSSRNFVANRVVTAPTSAPTSSWNIFTITRDFKQSKDDYPKEMYSSDCSTSDKKMYKNSSSCQNIDDDMLQASNYLDPLYNDFFINNSGEDIPAPKPKLTPATFKHVHYASNVEEQTPGSKDCSLLNELDPVVSHSPYKVLEGPDVRQMQEITLFLQDLEAEKSMPLELSKRILNDVVQIVKYYVKGHFVYLYGSYVSGLAVSTSNLNIALKSDMPPKNSFLLQLQKALTKGLNGYRVEPFEEDKNVKNSKICFSESETGVSCELVYLGSNVSNFRKMSHLLSDVCQFDPRIKTLLIATRIWAEVCLIHEPEDGKMHTLGYTLLMLHFLQGLEKPLLPIVDLSSQNLGLNPCEIRNDSSVGELWLAFLKFYSSEFNWEENIATIHCNSALLKSSKSWENSWIAIEDPFTQKNIGESVKNHECAQCIFSCFKATYLYFTSPMDFEDSDCSDSGSQNNISKKEIYSFNDITFDQNLPTYCEKCDELRTPCGKCRPSKEIILQNLPTLSDVSLNCVNTALHEVYKDFILPDSKIEGRKAYVRDLESCMKLIFPTAKLTLFGSSVNAFGFKRSDLDICMTLNHHPNSNIEKAAILSKVVRHLRKRSHLYKNVYGLYHAKIPIVRFCFIQEDWYCDLSLYNVLAVHNSTLLSKYALLDERCRIVGCAMKLLAKKARLDDTRSLSSYSYILMAIHYLQQVEPPVLPVLPLDDRKVFEEQLEVPKEILDGRNYWFYEDINKLRQRYLPYRKNNSTIGELWLGLLDFYARYDGTNAVTITQKEPLPSTSLRRCARLINIEDPFLTNHNLGCIVNETKAAETRKVLGRARLLFGKEIHKDWQQNPKKFFFSSSNLTGQFIKDVECYCCGGFGHEKSDCLKADPFKYSKFRMRIPNPLTRRPYIRKV